MHPTPPPEPGSPRRFPLGRTLLAVGALLALIALFGSCALPQEGTVDSVNLAEQLDQASQELAQAGAPQGKSSSEGSGNDSPAQDVPPTPTVTEASVPADRPTATSEPVSRAVSEPTPPAEAASAASQEGESIPAQEQPADTSGASGASEAQADASQAVGMSQEGQAETATEAEAPSKGGEGDAGAKIEEESGTQPVTPAPGATLEPTETPTETLTEAPTAIPTSTPTFTPAPTPTPSEPVAVTQPQRMNVRAGPGTNYDVVTTVPAGTVARILAVGPRNEWWQVQLDELDKPAWLFKGLTQAAGPLEGLPQLGEEQVPPTPTPAPVAVAPSGSAPAPAGGGSFGYGIQAHMVHTGQTGLVLDKVRELGFNWVKQQVEWRVFEPNPGEIALGELHTIVNEAGARGINVLFSVVNAPPWAREPGFDPNVGGPPGDPNTYANFVGRLAGEFCGSALKAIEVWNEQNLHYEWGNRPLNPGDYMNLLRPAYGAIKRACPSMLVISGAPTPAGSNPPWAMDDFAYLEGMFQNGLAAYADGIGAHPSGYNVPPSVGWQEACGVIQQTGNSFNGPCDNPHHSWSFRSTMEGYRNIALKYGAGDKRIWPTEFGWAAGGAFDPRYAYANDNDFNEQAAWTVEAYQMMRNWGWVGPAFLWNLNFRVVANGTEKAQWGIVNPDWSPLPVYNALRGMPK